MCHHHPVIPTKTVMCISRDGAEVDARVNFTSNGLQSDINAVLSERTVGDIPERKMEVEDMKEERLWKDGGGQGFY